MALTLDEAPTSPHRALRVTGLVGVVVAALVGVALVAVQHRTYGWNGAVVALVLGGAFVAVVALTSAWTDRRVWLAGLGLACVVVGSGIGRPRIDVYEQIGGDPTPGVLFEGGGGDLIARLDTWWPVVGVGLVLVVAALVWSFVSAAGAGWFRAAVGSITMLAVGHVLITVLTRDLVVGAWVSGRPVRRRGRPAHPHRSDHPPRSVADVWLRAADDERAAITAFGDLAARLESVGAPADLVRRARSAAADEVRHARVCQRLAGQTPPAHILSVPTTEPVVGLRHPQRRAELLRLATESFVDGVVGEGFAAGRLAVGATTARNHATATALRSMAADERRHADLGAEVVRWCHQRSPRLVGAALRAAARRTPPPGQGGGGDGFSEAGPAVTPGALAAAGLVGAGSAAEVWTQERSAALGWLHHDVLGAGRHPARRAGVSRSRRRSA